MAFKSSVKKDKFYLKKIKRKKKIEIPQKKKFWMLINLNTKKEFKKLYWKLNTKKRKINKFYIFTIDYWYTF